MNTTISVILWIIYLLSLYFAVFWFLVYLQGGIEHSKKRKVKRFPFLTIAIPAYNEEANIKATIESVLNLDYPKESFELIVIDDGSKDKTSKIAKDTLSKFKGFNTLLISKKNEGKGVAMNIALSKAKGEYFICLDGDSLIEKSAVKKMLPYFCKNDVASVLPCMKVSNPKNLLEKVQWYEYILNMYYKKLMGHLDCVHVAPGPFSMFKTNILKEVGGFAEDNLTEDLEITFRLQRHNYKIIQALDVFVYTKVPDTLSKLYRQRNRWFKGAIINAIDYRDMLFKNKFGHFGFIQLPMVLISGVLSLILVTTTAYYFVKPKLIFLKNMYFINFDFMTLIREYTFEFHLVDGNYMLLSVSIIMFFVGVLTLYLAHKYTKEKVLKQGILPLFMFMFMYFIYFGIVWGGIFFDLARGKVQKW